MAKKNKSSSKSKKAETKLSTIKIYSTPGCPWCAKVKGYLIDNKLKYKEIDVSTDHDALDYIVGKSGELSVPQTEINGNVLVGFDKEGLDREIQKLKNKK